MKSSILKTSALAYLLPVFSSLALFQDQLPNLIKKVAPSVVVVFAYDSGGALISQGSGFFLNSTAEIITNYHVMRGAIRAEVKNSKGEIYSVKGIVAEDRASDLVRLAVSNSLTTTSYLLPSRKTSEVGEKVLVIGSPLGLEQTVSDGIVSAIREIPSHGRVIQISAPVSPGSSGSPVINMAGNVIGVVSFQLVDGQNLNFVTPIEKVTELNVTALRSLRDWTLIASKQRSVLLHSLLSQALLKLLEEDYRGAISLYRQATASFPEAVEALWGLGHCLAEVGRLSEALNAFERAILINPNNPEAYYEQAQFYSKIKNIDGEINAYKQVIRLEPRHWRAYSGLASAYSKTKDYNKAIIASLKCIATVPYNKKATAYLHLGAIYRNLGDRSNAIELYEQVLEFDSTGVSAYNAYSDLVHLYREIGSHQKAIHACKQMIRLDPETLAGYYALAFTYEELGQYQQALEMCKRIHQINPDDSMAYTCFASIYEEQGEYDRAIAAYRQAILKDPQDGYIYLNLAMIYIQLERRDAALEVYEALRKIRPELAETLSDLIHR